MSYFGTTEWDIQVRRGLDPKVSEVSLLGHSDAVGTSAAVLHHEHDVLDLSVVALYDTPIVVQVASTDDTNDNAAGTGALTVLVSGVNSAGALVSESVTMTGQTATTATTAVFSAVHSLTVLTSGVTNANTGTIWCGSGTFTAGVPAVAYMSMEIGTGLSRGVVYKVPTGNTLYLKSFAGLVSDTTKLLNLQVLTYNGSNQYEVFDIHTKSTEVIIPVISFPGIPADTMFWVVADSDAAATIVSVAVAAFLVAD